jgi:gliding motility-associated lipoprotein GldH
MMRMMSKHLVALSIIITISIFSLASCDKNTVFDKYDHTPLQGWEKNDTLIFEVPPVTATGLYRANMGLRINGAFPFMSLCLVVEQTIYPSHRVITDTLNYHLINKNGTSQGQGLSYYQYSFPITELTLNKGDSIHICIRHNMKRDILPGISDIGVKISKYQ